MVLSPRQRGTSWSLAAAISLAAAASAQLAVSFCNTFPLGATATDQHGQTFTVAGLSGIAHLGEDSSGTDHFVAVMDNSNKLVFIGVMTDWNGCITAAWFEGGLTLSETRDFEGIVVTNGELFLAEEGTPAIHRFDMNSGQRIATLPTPAVYAARRPNFGFESLGTDSSGDLWTANEEALTVDGPLSSPTVGTVVRLVRYTRAGSGYVPAEQFAYRCEPLHGSAITGARSGLSDLLGLEGSFVWEGSSLALERSFAFSFDGFFENRIFFLGFGSASNIASMPALAGQVYTPVSKSPLWIGHLNGNLEGIAAGRRLGFAHTSVIGIIDDGDPISVNMLAGFSLGYPRCVGDFNEDGGVDGADLEAFFLAWEAGDPNADVNRDGGLDGGDVETFFEVWEGGSCF